MITTTNPTKEEIAIREKIFKLLSSYLSSSVKPEGVTKVKTLFLCDGDHIKAMSNLKEEMIPKEYKKFSDLVDKDIAIQDLIKIKSSIETIQQLIFPFILLYY